MGQVLEVSWVESARRSVGVMVIQTRVNGSINQLIGGTTLRFQVLSNIGSGFWLYLKKGGKDFKNDKKNEMKGLETTESNQVGMQLASTSDRHCPARA